jgi:hypothetical protein
MPRYAAVIDIAKTAGVAKLGGGTVQVNIPNTSVPIPATLYAGPATLSNPFTTSTGAVEFWLAAPEQVDVAITPMGQPAQTVSGIKCATTTPVANPITAFGGRVTNWFLN